MIKTFGKITLAALLGAMAVGLPLQVSADDSTTNKATTTPAAPAKHRNMTTFRGKLDAVDVTAKTITVENKTQPKRTFEITPDTKIMKDGKPATLSDGVVGEDVGGSYTNSSGKMIAKTVYFGKPTGAPKKPAAPPAPAN